MANAPGSGQAATHVPHPTQTSARTIACSGPEAAAAAERAGFAEAFALTSS
jgi:hypothetical protein